MKTELKILKYLIENNAQKYTINQISKNLEISYKIVYEIISRLEGENLINVELIGKPKLISYNFNFNSKVFDVENIRLQELLKNKNLKFIFKKIQNLNYPFMTVLLFGSYAKGTEKKGSDIDLCIICDSEKIIKQLYNSLKLIPLDIHLNDFTYDEFVSMIKLKTFNVGNEIKKSNIIFTGCENYYNILNSFK